MDGCLLSQQRVNILLCSVFYALHRHKEALTRTQWKVPKDKGSGLRTGVDQESESFNQGTNAHTSRIYLVVPTDAVKEPTAVWIKITSMCNEGIVNREKSKLNWLLSILPWWLFFAWPGKQEKMNSVYQFLWWSHERSCFGVNGALTNNARLIKIFQITWASRKRMECKQRLSSQNSSLK